jgi:hypothetical protein
LYLPNIVAISNKCLILAATIIIGTRVREFFDQRRVCLAKLISGAGHEKPFRRLPGESQSAMRHRLYEGERGRDSAWGKVAGYERAISFGADFPPVFVFNLKGIPVLHDGWHRCAAAALRGHDHISAVVFNVYSAAEGESLADLLFEQRAYGTPWRECVLAARAFLRARRAVGEQAT